VEQPRTFRIARGIGQYDFNDYYAVLGLPLTAEASHVRKRYLLIAKCLHPDIHGRTDAEKQIATQYLSKLVNPAYNVLCQERERTEYSAILKLLGKRLMKRNQQFTPQSELAKKYLTSSAEINYEQTIKDIAKIQYHDLELALENISLLSELNLVHILLQEGYKPLNESFSSASTNSSTANSSNNVSNVNNNRTNSSYQMRSESQTAARNPARTSSSTSSNSTKNTSQANPSQTNPSSINQSIRQAESYINQQLWASALKELRVVIQIDCNNSKCHSLLGFVYMNQKLVGMAKVSFQQALKLNPAEPLALKYIAQVGGTSPNTQKSQSKPKDDKKGGFFGWLGGG
jgi:curved DNA-binding protein CbpA